MKKLYFNYLESFKGLSKEIWYLALISVVNRAGTMVIPFLSLYLNDNLGFSKDDTSWILAFFGIGSLIGGFIGGKLTDIIGFYKVMVMSLFLTGIGFIALQHVTSFWGLSIGILLLMSVADTFRPAIYVSLKAYSKPKNQTRSLALIRLAINLGMGIGPTLAGFLIVKKGYNLLFWIDGITCILAIALFTFLVKEVKNVKTTKKEEIITKEKNVVYSDFSYWIFIAICFLMGMMFFQYFVAFPLYAKEIFFINEFNIGLIMGINVAIIVIFEMPMVNYLEKKAIKNSKLILYASVFFALSFLALIDNLWFGILIIHVIIITIGEMLGFPYTNAYAIKRAKSGFEGSYMALYAMAFSLAHIFSPKIGLTTIDNYGYKINWMLTGAYGLAAVLLSVWLHNRTKNNL